MSNLSSVWLATIGQIRSWERGGIRAPHKPLLLLLALGRFQRTGASEISFAEVEQPLGDLLREYGQPDTRPHPEYPFYHLQSDQLWILDPVISARPGASPTRQQLLEAEVVGQLSPEFLTALRADPLLLAAVARKLLDANFPVSLHADLCAEVGLDLESVEAGQAVQRSARDPSFRKAVLLAYEYRCAVCGYQGQLAGQFVGLDAAHVRWWAADGPDSIDNGLCLCSLHHKLLDSGVISISDGHDVLVSKYFIGQNDVAQTLVIAYAGAQLLPPQAGYQKVAAQHLAWHRAQVFKRPARYTG